MTSSRRKTSAGPPPSSRDADLPALFERLRQASGSEALDQRRALLLQCQLAQLERQLLVLSEAAAQRRAVLEALSDSCSRLVLLCRQAVAQEVAGPVVPVRRAQLTAIIEQCGVVQGELTKHVDDLLDDRLHLSSLLPNRFARRDLQLKEMAASSQGLAFLNLGRVRALEGQLMTLYKTLLALSKGLEWQWANSLAPRDSRNPFEGQLSRALQLLPAATKEVGELGVLIPSPAVPPAAPPPDLGAVCVDAEVRRYVREIRNGEARAAVEGHLKCLKQRAERLETEKAVLEAELANREAASGRRTAAAASLLEGLRAGCGAFRRSLRGSLVEPFEAVFDAFEVLESSPDRRRQELFLSACREHFPLLRLCLSQLDGQLAAGEPADPLFEELRAAFLKQVRDEDSAP